MRKALFDELMGSVREMMAAERGSKRSVRVARATGRRATDVRALRDRLGVSQSKFAAILAVSRSTVQSWEQGRRQPDGPAKVLLRIADKHPSALLSVAMSLPRRKARTAP